MKKGFTERVFILDRSGSMAGLEGDTLGGFNAMIERQKQLPGKACVSAVLFDHESVVLHDRVDIQKVRPMTGEDYAVRGCTALLDAVGQATGFCPGTEGPFLFAQACGIIKLVLLAKMHPEKPWPPGAKRGMQ